MRSKWKRMTIATFDLTEHTQASIRGTTGTHPNSKFVFGIHIGTDELHTEQSGFTPDICAYEDMDWSKAVKLAKWILDTKITSNMDIIEHNVTDCCVAAGVWDPVTEGLELCVSIAVKRDNLSGGMRDICGWERAVQMAKWILEWEIGTRG